MKEEEAKKVIALVETVKSFEGLRVNGQLQHLKRNHDGSYVVGSRAIMQGPYRGYIVDNVVVEKFTDYTYRVEDILIRILQDGTIKIRDAYFTPSGTKIRKI